MGLRKVEIQKLNSLKGGMLDFYSTQPSHEIMPAFPYDIATFQSVIKQGDYPLTF